MHFYTDKHGCSFKHMSGSLVQSMTGDQTEDPASEHLTSDDEPQPIVIQEEDFGSHDHKQHEESEIKNQNYSFANQDSHQSSDIELEVQLLQETPNLLIHEKTTAEITMSPYASDQNAHVRSVMTPLESSVIN